MVVLALLLLSLVTPTTDVVHPHVTDHVAVLAAEPLPHVTATALPAADLPPVVVTEPPRGLTQTPPPPAGPAPSADPGTAFGARAPPSR
ncbi:hypothetical protein GCM10027445_17240 [Amycolatopsis endophytica]|uniref:hypothetical protein n=1 Tax=Amycolatopsis endophytica TaxID=860233 RepID=UPI0028A74226|nr:hypothetical protein [Amycolatopsis endophytica]